MNRLRSRWLIFVAVLVLVIALLNPLGMEVR